MASKLDLTGTRRAAGCVLNYDRLKKRIGETVKQATASEIGPVEEPLFSEFEESDNALDSKTATPCSLALPSGHCLS
jgi:hypothetical protein